jgi:hypothetical protein
MSWKCSEGRLGWIGGICRAGSRRLTPGAGCGLRNRGAGRRTHALGFLGKNFSFGEAAALVRRYFPIFLGNGKLRISPATAAAFLCVSLRKFGSVWRLASGPVGNLKDSGFRIRFAPKRSGNYNGKYSGK